MTLKDQIEKLAPSIREFWFDVDGVMTHKGGVTIYDVHSDDAVGCFERVNGLRSIRLVTCDDNGVPIPNTIEYIAGLEGEPIMEGYRFDTRDGKVVEYLIENGYPVYFISGRDSPCVRKRAEALGATAFLGEKDKLAVIKKHAKCSLSEVMFIGDGIQDCEALSAVGLPIAPSDACSEAVRAAVNTTSSIGGEGVMHEAISIFLKARGMWPDS
jgi:3-deoxy-D-manno-octulosonate 8-phosphate phosphatase (KDO 8-P phosphatase)